MSDEDSFAASSVFLGHEFHVDESLGDDLATELEELIKENGGDVIAVVPEEGYIVANLSDPIIRKKRQRLERREDKPNLHYVSLGFVHACIIRGSIVPVEEHETCAVFIRNGQPIRMHLHKSITQRRQRLEEKITNAGGDPRATEQEATVIITSNDTPWFERLRDKYANDPNKHVERVPWVTACINRREYYHERTIRKGVTGRRTGAPRNGFTQEDDMCLASYIAERIPDNDKPDGRSGNNLYKQLCERVDVYPWSIRHPWQSWRERYVRNMSQFRAMIAEQVRKHEVAAEGLGQYTYRSRSRIGDMIKTEDRSGESGDDDEDMDEVDQIIGTPQRGKKRGRDASSHDSEDETVFKRPKAIPSKPARPTKDIRPADRETSAVPRRSKQAALRSAGARPTPSQAGPSRLSGITMVNSSQRPSTSTQGQLHSNASLMNVEEEEEDGDDELFEQAQQLKDTMDELLKIAQDTRWSFQDVVEHHKESGDDVSEVREHFENLRKQADTARPRAQSRRRGGVSSTRP